MSLETLNKRLEFRGGDEDGRIVKDKLRSFLKSRNGSYQKAHIQLPSLTEEYVWDRQFLGLINPDKTKEDYKNMILSLAYKDVDENRKEEGVVDTGIKSGQVFYWAEKDSYWIIYMQRVEERAYFRAEIRRCDKEVTINGKTYHVYYRGPQETTLQEKQKAGVEMNLMNYSSKIFITKDENTTKFFKRFAKIQIDDEYYEVVAHNNATGDGVIEVALKETYEDKFPDPEIQEPDNDTGIVGPTIVYPYDKVTYNYEGGDGAWLVDNKKAVIREQTSTSANIEIVTGKKGSFTLTYKQKDKEDIVLPVEIHSL